MPLLKCPQCGVKTAVRRKLLGQSVRCPRCATRFLAQAPGLDLRLWLQPGHRAGLWLAIGLFGVALAVAGTAIIAAALVNGGFHIGLQSPMFIGSGITWLYAALGCGTVGALLYLRWRQAQQKRQWP